MNDNWYDDHRNLSELWTWLVSTGIEPDDPAYFMEKPWKWEDHWFGYAEQRDEVAAAGRVPDDDHPF